MITEDEIQETTWSLCKKYDAMNRKRDRILLMNFIAIEIDKLFGINVTNDYSQVWQKEVRLFVQKYNYTI